MKKLSALTSFHKDWKKLQKKHYNKQELLDVITLLLDGSYIPAKYHDHALSGDKQGFRDIHVRPNWIVIYKTTETEVILVATGSHDDLFK